MSLRRAFAADALGACTDVSLPIAGDVLGVPHQRVAVASAQGLERLQRARGRLAELDEVARDRSARSKGAGEASEQRRARHGPEATR